MRFFRIPSFTGIETHRDDADRGSLRTVEGCIPHGPGGLRSGPVWSKMGEVDIFSSDDHNQASGSDDEKGNSALFVSRRGEVHDMLVFSKENTAFVSLGVGYDVMAAGAPYTQSDAVITPVGNNLYAIGDGSVEASTAGPGPPDTKHSVYPDETIYSQEWSRFPRCKFYVQGPKKTIFASGNPADPLVVYVSEPAGMTQPIRDNPYSTTHSNHIPGILSQVRILSSNASRITALSTRGDKVLVHTDKGCHMLLAPGPEQASTGYRVEQVASTNTSSAVNSQVVAGDGGTQPFWLGFDGAIYKDTAATRGAEDFKSYSDPQQASWKSKGRWEQNHPNNLGNSFATYDPQSGMYWVYIESEEAPIEVIPAPSVGPENLSLGATPAQGVTDLKLTTLPDIGPVNLRAVLQPPETGPENLELVSSPKIGPDTLELLASPFSGPNTLQLLASPFSGPNTLDLLTAPKSGPSSLDTSGPIPVNGPTGVNAEQPVTLEWDGLNNGWNLTNGFREDFAGLPNVASSTTMLMDNIVDTTHVRASNPFTISGPDAAFFFFSTTGTNSSLRLIGPLDYETKSSYSIVITVHATNGDTIFMNFGLDVVDVAEAPTSGPTSLSAAQQSFGPASGPTSLNAVQPFNVACPSLHRFIPGSGSYSARPYFTQLNWPTHSNNFGYQSFQNVSTPTTLAEMNATGGSGSTCFEAMTKYFPGDGTSLLLRSNSVCSFYQHWLRMTYSGVRNLDTFIASASNGPGNWDIGNGYPSWHFQEVVGATGGVWDVWLAAGSNGIYKICKRLGSHSVPFTYSKAGATQCSALGGEYVLDGGSTRAYVGWNLSSGNNYRDENLNSYTLPV